MIHDRELIYDAKKQLHDADKDYKHDSPAKMYGKKDSPAKNSGLGPKVAGSGDYMGSPAKNVGCKYTKKK
jgi:hypothetical protein